MFTEQLMVNLAPYEAIEYAEEQDIDLAYFELTIHEGH